jgi:hypothetical protein
MSTHPHPSLMGLNIFCPKINVPQSPVKSWKNRYRICTKPSRTLETYGGKYCTSAGKIQEENWSKENVPTKKEILSAPQSKKKYTKSPYDVKVDGRLWSLYCM